MSVLVLDSGIFIASVFPDEKLNVEAKAILKQTQADKTQLVAPHLLHYELLAVSRKAVYQARISPEDGIKARDIMLAYPVQLYFDEALLKRAYEIATEFNRPTAYDSQYLALAERLSCDFWTADERLLNTVKSKLSWVKWLGNHK